ncbi:hypothetical protein DN540_37190, partial [Burkholderia multivorans]
MSGLTGQFASQLTMGFTYEVAHSEATTFFRSERFESGARLAQPAPTHASTIGRTCPQSSNGSTGSSGPRGLSTSASAQACTSRSAPAPSRSAR